MLAVGDIEIEVMSRSTPQEGVTRYTIDLRLEERDPGLDDQQASALLRQAFTDALNASHFLRVCAGDMTVELVARTPAAAPVLPRAA